MKAGKLLRAFNKNSRPFTTFLFLFILGSLILNPNKVAWADPCSLDGMKVSDGALGYQKRQIKDSTQSRCEGLYQSPVNSKFEIISLLWGGLAYKDNSTLHVHWPSDNSQSSLFITGTSKIPGVFYRMDAIIDEKLPFHWPVSEVLRDVGISSENLGVFGWFKTNGKIIYVPIKITELNQVQKKIEQETVTLIMRADFDLERVILRKLGDPSMQNWTVINERFSAGEPISVDLQKWISVAKGENFPLQVIAKIIDDEEQILETFYIRFIR